LIKDKYPWLNLIEMNNEKHIWERYGISDSGGCIYLIGSDGNIISVDPDAEEVERELKELLKN